MRTADASVLINNYNNAPFIKACVESVLRQTAPPDEIIVYDDGSTDGSVQILRSFGDRIVLIEGVHDATRSSRHNQANAVVRSLERSRGEWIFLLDGDDVFLPQKIERVLASLSSEKGVSLVQSPVTLIDATGREIGRYRDARFHLSDLREAIYEQQDVDFFYPTSSLVVSRAAFRSVLPLDMQLCPELACDTRIAMLMPLLGRVITLDEPLACWRRHAASYIAELSRSRWFQVQQTIRRVRTFNACAPAYSSPEISLWRNRRFWRQLAGALLPEAARRKLRRTGTIFQGEASTAAAG